MRAPEESDVMVEELVLGGVKRRVYKEGVLKVPTMNSMFEVAG